MRNMTSLCDICVSLDANCSGYSNVCPGTAAPDTLGSSAHAHVNISKTRKGKWTHTHRRTCTYTPTLALTHKYMHTDTHTHGPGPQPGNILTYANSHTNCTCALLACTRVIALTYSDAYSTADP